MRLLAAAIVISVLNGFPATPDPAVSAPSAMFLVTAEQDSDPMRDHLRAFAVERLRLAPPVDAPKGEAAPRAEPRMERVPWPADSLEWFYLRSGGNQSNWDALRADGDSPQVAFVQDIVGDTGISGLDLSPQTETFDATALARFIDARGNSIDVDRALLPQAGPVRVRREESAKTVILDDEAPRGRAVPMSKAGQHAELRPLLDPTDADSDLAFEIVMATRRPDRLRVVLTPASGGEVREALTDSEGTCTFGSVGAGQWRAEVHVLQPHAAKQGETNPPAWELLTATLTFERKNSP